MGNLLTINYEKLMFITGVMIGSFALQIIAQSMKNK
jgi:hypothetical protein